MSIRFLNCFVFVFWLCIFAGAFPSRIVQAQNIEAARGHYQQGLTWEKQNKFAEAEGAFRQAIQRDATQADYHQHLALTLVRQNKMEAAEASLRTAVQIEPRQWLHYALLGAVLEKQGKIADAEAMQKKADELKNAPPDAAPPTSTLGPPPVLLPPTSTPNTPIGPPPILLPNSSIGGAALGSPNLTMQVPANRAWTPTGIMVRDGLEITLTATGIIEGGLTNNAYFRAVPPEGRSERQNRFPQPLLPGLSLIGRIGNGAVFPVGAAMKFTADTALHGLGELQLGINDDTPGDNSGAWTVLISTTQTVPSNFVVAAPAKKIVVDSAKITSAAGRVGNYFLLTILYHLTDAPAEGTIVRGSTELNGPMKATSTLAGRTVRANDSDLKALAGGEIDKPGDYVWTYTIKADGYETVTGEVRFQVAPAN